MSEAAFPQPYGAGNPAPTWVIQGREVALPVRVRRASTAAAMYLVPTAAVRRLVTHPNLQLPELWPGRTLCTLALVDYVDNDLGDYNEISVTFFVQYGTRRPSRFLSLPLGLTRGTAHAYIHRLPVNQSFTCEAGCSIWGFPKTVDEIEFDDADGRRRCTWRKDGRLVLRMDVATGGRQSYRDRRMWSFACREGVLTRTPFVSHGEQVGVKLGGAVLELGDHPIADELRTLGLPKRALVTNWVGNMSAEFWAAEKL